MSVLFFKPQSKHCKSCNQDKLFSEVEELEIVIAFMKQGN
jgi:hypothetical protein